MDEAITEIETTEDAPKGDAPKQLRDALKRANAENTKLKSQIMAGAYEELGLDPTTGLGKAIQKEYDGDTSVEGLAAYADNEYGYKPPVGTDHPEAGVITTQQAQLDAAAQSAGSVTPPTELDALAKAEAEGDAATSMAIKGNQVARMFQGR